jgi:hypothetical protein
LYSFIAVFGGIENKRIERRRMDLGYGEQAKYSLLRMIQWFTD